MMAELISSTASANNPYSTVKLIHHPEAITAIKAGTVAPLIQVHFMPMLACNQSCSFCAYGHRVESDGPEQQGWKNMELMSDAHMPKDIMLQCVRDWADMGVKAVEITGGGEPLIYPHIDECFQELAKTTIDTALVTNGTALTDARADWFTCTNWKWARVSIDAGSPKTYCATRRVPESHWHLAWKAVSRLVARKFDNDQRVGVGYVVDYTNYDGVYEGIRLAKEHGADNVRVGAAFTPHLLDRFKKGTLSEALSQTVGAKREFEDETFKVHNLLQERIDNLASPTQDYKFCGVKEVLCVVGGDCNVYTCCTLAFNKKGSIGSIADQTFRELWDGEQKRKFFSRHDARRICTMECLYEKRNKAIIRMKGQADKELDAVRKGASELHKNFI